MNDHAELTEAIKAGVYRHRVEYSVEPNRSHDCDLSVRVIPSETTDHVYFAWEIDTWERWMKLSGHHPFDLFVETGDVLCLCLRQGLPERIVHEVFVQLRVEGERLVVLKSSTTTDIFSRWDETTDDLADFLQLLEVPHLKRIDVAIL